jgi:putative transposase
MALSRPVCCSRPRGHRGANTAAIINCNADHDADAETRQVEDLNNTLNRIVGQSREWHERCWSKAFWSAAVTIPGIDIMHMIRKGQLRSTGNLRPAQKFHSWAA